MSNDELKDETGRYLAAAARHITSVVGLELRAREEAARNSLHAEYEPVVCCESQEFTELVVRHVEDGGERVRQLQPDGSVVSTTVECCPFCGVRYHPETAA